AEGAGDADDPGDRVLAEAEAQLDALADWLGRQDNAAPPGESSGADRLFRTLYPEVVGRRSPREIIARVRRKWELSHVLPRVLDEVRGPIRVLAGLKGPAPEVLGRMKDAGREVMGSAREMTALVDGLRDRGIDPGRVELDLGFGRGIGFYSQ